MPHHTITGKLKAAKLETKLGLTSITLTLEQHAAGYASTQVRALRVYPTDHASQAALHMLQLDGWKEQSVAAAGNALVCSPLGVVLVGCTSFGLAGVSAAAHDATAAAQPAANAWPLSPAQLRAAA